MNTRRAMFADWRVREAMIHAFNFEFMNQTLTAGRGTRITSYFSNSELGMRPGPATGRVLDLLTPFAADLSPETLERTLLGKLGNGHRVNLERALKLGDRLGGHIVQGHVDGPGIVAAIEPVGRDFIIRIRAEQSLLDEEQDVLSALKVMHQAGVNHLLVSRGESKPVGVVSALALADELDAKVDDLVYVRLDRDHLSFYSRYDFSILDTSINAESIGLTAAEGSSATFYSTRQETAGNAYLIGFPAVDTAAQQAGRCEDWIWSTLPSQHGQRFTDSPN